VSLRERDVLDGLSAGFRAVYSTWWVEAEVNNGGLNQYFWNSSGEFARDAVAGFDRIGVPAMARLMERGIAIRDQDEAKNKKFGAKLANAAFSDGRIRDAVRAHCEADEFDATEYSAFSL